MTLNEERCVDASVAVKWAVKGEPFRAKALAFLKDAGKRGVILIAPPYFVSEVDSAIRKRVFDGKMTPEEDRRHMKFSTMRRSNL